MEQLPPSPDDLAAGSGPTTIYRRSRVRGGAVVALAAAAGAGVWAVIGNDANGTSQTTLPRTTAAITTAAPIGPVGMSASGISKLADSVSQPIYWAGPKAGTVYELTRTSTGKVFVRYLPLNAKVGTKQTIYLIIATYPFKNALQALKNMKGSNKLTIPGGGIAVVDSNHPQSVHLAYPGSDVQIEVYDPSPARSLRVAQSGAVRPVPPPPAPGVAAAPSEGGRS
jgi:hypothetical protein